MRKVLIAAGWLLAIAGTALAQQNQGTGGPKPGNQQGGLFPPNQPVPMYSTSANNQDASLGTPGAASPNAGNTGATGSGSPSYGWAPRAYSSTPGQQQ